MVRNVLQPRHAKLYSFGWNNRYDGQNGWHGFLDLSWNKTKRNELVFETYAGTRLQLLGPERHARFSDERYRHRLHQPQHRLFRSRTRSSLPIRGAGAAGSERALQARLLEQPHRQRSHLAGTIGEISKDLNSQLPVSHDAVGANYTNHEKSLTPDEAFVQLATRRAATGAPATSTISAQPISAGSAWATRSPSIRSSCSTPASTRSYRTTRIRTSQRRLIMSTRSWGRCTRMADINAHLGVGRADRQHRRAGGAHRSELQRISSSTGRPALSLRSTTARNIGTSCPA